MKFNSKAIKTIKVSFLVGGLFLGTLFGNAANVYAVSDKVVAIVNDHVITQSELDARFVAFKQHLQQIGAPQMSSGEMRKKVLDELINIDLQLQVAKRANINVSEQTLDLAVADTAKRSNISVERLKLELQKQGIRYQDFRRQIRNNITLSELTQAVFAKKITISDEEINQFLKSNPTTTVRSAPQVIPVFHVVDVLIPVEEHASASEKAAASSVAQSVAAKLKGSSVETVLADSAFAGKSLSQSDLGWRMADQLPGIFAASVVQLRPQEVTRPLAAPNGLHVLKLLEVRGVSPRGQGTVVERSVRLSRDEARAMIYNSKLEKELKPWLQRLHNDSYIKIMNDEES